MGMSNVIQPQINCTTAREFLDTLSPLGDLFGNLPDSEKWIFRGQGVDLPLIPSAFRNDGKFANLTHRDVSKRDERLRAERDMLIDFFDIADKRGLVLPDDSQQLRLLLETLRSDRGDHLVAQNDEDWRTVNKTLSLTALAQHYGVPTRLLDWTRQAFIAAFFAAEDAWNRLNTNRPTEIVVWAFYFPLLGKHDVIARLTDPIQIVTAPSATNRNLQAQQGVFTLLNLIYFDELSYPGMEQFLEERSSYVTNPAESPSAWLVTNSRMRKFMLPSSEALSLLKLLAKLDITSSSVYPGYERIVNELKLRVDCERSKVSS